MNAPVPLPIPLLLAALLLAPVGCRAPGAESATPPPPTLPSRDGPAPPPFFALLSPAFRDGSALPAAFTCDGRGGSPPLTWEALPFRTRSLALIVEDPDAPGGTAIQWVVWGIPAATRELAEGARPGGSVREGQNSSGATGWSAPCPPAGPAHRVHFRLYALDLEPDLPPGASALHLHAAMYRHVLAEAVLTARYARTPRRPDGSL
jgi:hypothetical protein